MGSTAAIASISSSVLTGTQSLFGGIGNANSYEAEGKFQRQQYEFNARLAEKSAEDALKKGVTDSTQLKKSAKRLIGSQRAALAASGVEVDSGSALELQVDTANEAENDAIKIVNNAKREAFGYKLSALDLRGQGAFAEMNANAKASQSILSGGLGFASGLLKGTSTYAENFGGKRAPNT